MNTFQALAAEQPAPPNHREALVQAVESLLTGEDDMIAAMANAAAVVYHGMPQLNWVGFYILRGRELVLGPFQGLPACVRIAMGKGVCGTAAAERRTVVVDDVEAFPGHIACDVASRSEVVVPVYSTMHELLGVFDIDSPELARFTSDDVVALERVAIAVGNCVR
jgi:L-methionine (R)-S-oxide reductase